MSFNTAELLKLPVGERYDIALALWDSIEGDELPITEDERVFAEMRLKEHLNNPQEVIKWDDARTQLIKEYGI